MDACFQCTVTICRVTHNSLDLLVHIAMIVPHICCRFVSFTSMIQISLSSKICSYGLAFDDCGGHLNRLIFVTWCFILLKPATGRWLFWKHKANNKSKLRIKRKYRNNGKSISSNTVSKNLGPWSWRVRSGLTYDLKLSPPNWNCLMILCYNLWLVIIHYGLRPSIIYSFPLHWPKKVVLSLAVKKSNVSSYILVKQTFYNENVKPICEKNPLAFLWKFPNSVKHSKGLLTQLFQTFLFYFGCLQYFILHTEAKLFQKN